MITLKLDAEEVDEIKTLLAVELRTQRGLTYPSTMSENMRLERIETIKSAMAKIDAAETAQETRRL